MRKILLVAMISALSLGAFAQSFEISGLQDSYKGTIGETIRAPLRLKNTTEKPIVLIIRRLHVTKYTTIRSLDLGSIHVHSTIQLLSKNCVPEKQ